jgi:hypothetical protein
MEGGEPDPLLLQGALAPEVMLTAIEEGQRVAAAVRRREIQLVEARVPHGAVLAEMEDLRRAGMKKLSLSGLQLREPVADGFQEVHLLQEGDHHLAALFFRGAGAASLDTLLLVGVVNHRGRGSIGLLIPM